MKYFFAERANRDISWTGKRYLVGYIPLGFPMFALAMYTPAK